MWDSWFFKSKYDFNEKNFCKIFDFFVIKTPIVESSYRGISFNERKFSSANEVQNYLKKLFNGSCCVFECISKEECVDETLKMNGIFQRNFSFEYAVFQKHETFSKTSSFFYCIRCALAHGAFCIEEFNGEKYYYFENFYKEKGRGNYKTILKGKIFIREKTLINIINFCDSRLV